MTDEQVFEVLRKAFPSLNDSHFRIMKETSHHYWEQATQVVIQREIEKGSI